MKIIRMTKTMSGPQGTFPVGQVRTVDDVTAAMLIGAEAAKLVRNIAPAPDADASTGSATVADGELTEAETATIDPVVETADVPVKARRKKVAV